MKSTQNSNLSSFFKPRSIAVVGSFKKQPMGGYGVIKNLINFGFAGRIYPINPSYSETLGMTAYPDVRQVNDSIDMAIVITPSPIVPKVIKECAQKGIKAAIIISDGFAEADEEGMRLQKEIVEISHQTGIRLIGPNTIGVVDTANNLVTTPYFTGYSKIREGTIVYAAQTGIAGAQALPLEDYAYPISKMCDFGNKCDINEVDLLEYLATDSETKVIAMHLEDIKDGRQFLNVARKVIPNKPVLVLKPGRNEASTNAMSSHTGSLAGDDKVYNGAFKQAGVIRLDTWRELLEIPRVFVSQPLPSGNRLGIVTMTGGAGIMIIDAAVESGLTIAQLSPPTIDKLADISPRIVSNPVDIGQVWTLINSYIPTLEPAIAAVLADKSVDCVAIVVWASTMPQVPEITEMFYRLKQQFSKPMTIWIYGTNLAVAEELSRELEAIGLPTYSNLETAIKALGVAAKYAQIRSRFNAEPIT